MRPLLSFLVIVLVYFSVTSAFAQEAAVPESKTQIQLSYAPVVKRVAPAVVNIYTKRVVKERVSPFMGDPFFDSFMGGSGLTRERVVRSLGSGVIVDAKGSVITSNHVIEGSDAIMVVLADGREFKATVENADKGVDLALLKLEEVKKDLPFLSLRDSDTLEVGDLVLALGNPFGVGQTVTSGIVSALARSAAGISDYGFFIQTDAAINPGNSGGALVDMDGKLVGINTAIYSKSGGSIGIGFAIPSAMVTAFMRGSPHGGGLVRPWLGASYQEMTSEMAQAMGSDTQRGALIRDVFDDSPAQAAGLKSGDIITAVAGVKISSVQDLKFRLAIAEIDKPLSMVYLRAGQEHETEVMPTLPPEKPAADKRLLKGNSPLMGLIVANLSPRLAMQLNKDVNKQGVIVVEDKVDAGQSRYGVNVGDIILAVNNVKVTSSKQLDALTKSGARAWQITFARGEQVMNLRVVP